MKPETWVIEDIRSLRAIPNRNSTQEAYLSLLLWYTKMIQGKGE